MVEVVMGRRVPTLGSRYPLRLPRSSAAGLEAADSATLEQLHHILFVRHGIGTGEAGGDISAGGVGEADRLGCIPPLEQTVAQGGTKASPARAR